MIDPREYGADPAAPSSVNAKAFEAWAGVASALGGVAYIPPGFWLSDRKISIRTPHPLRIVADGTICFQEAAMDAGLEVEAVSIQNLRIEGFRATTNTLNLHTMLRVICPSLPSGTHKGPEIVSCVAVGQDPAAHGWKEGIVLERAWNAILSGNHIKGRDDITSPFAVDTGILILDCMATKLRDNSVSHVEKAILFGGSRIEGIQLSGGELVGVGLGIVLPPMPFVLSGTSIVDVHINAASRCVQASNAQQITMRGLHLYKTHVAVGYWQAVELANCQNVQVRGSTIYGSLTATGGCDGISLANSHGCIIQGNTFNNFEAAGAIVVLATGSSDCKVKDNVRGVNCNAAVEIGAGAGNVIVDS